MKRPYSRNIFVLKIIEEKDGGAWVAQSVKHPTSAPVMILGFVSLSPTSGSVLSAQSLFRIPCPPLTAPPPHVCALSLSKINKHF